MAECEGLEAGLVSPARTSPRSKQLNMNMAALFIEQSSNDKTRESCDYSRPAASADQDDGRAPKELPSSPFPDRSATSRCDRRPSRAHRAAQRVARPEKSLRDKEISEPRVDRRRVDRRPRLRDGRG